MPISPLPTPPSTSDPANFDARADAFLAALPAFQAEANALEANVNAKEASTTQAVADAMAAGLANAADNAAATAEDRVQTGQDRIATAADAQRAEDAAAAAGAIVGFPAPMPGDIGKFLGVGPGQEMDWFPAGVRMVTEYLTSGTSWTAPANLLGGSVEVEATGGGGGGAKTITSSLGAGAASACYRHFTVSGIVPDATYPCAVGANGASNPGGAVAAATAGGDTTIFGLTAGGSGGATAGVASGAVSTGLTLGLNRIVNGEVGLAVGSSGNSGSSGGSTPLGDGGLFVFSAPLKLPTGFGSGGSAAAATTASQAGCPGVIKLTYLVSI